MAQGSSDPTEEGVVEGDEFLGKSALVHQLRSEDEIGDRDQHVGGNARKHAVGDDAHQALTADHVAARRARERHDDGDGRSDEKQEYEDGNREGHQVTFFGSAPMASVTTSSAFVSCPSRTKPWERCSRMIAPLRGTVTAVKYCGMRIMSDTM